MGAGAIETRKAGSKPDLIKLPGGTARWRGWAPSARDCDAVPHVLRRNPPSSRPPCVIAHQAGTTKNSFLQLALQRFDLFGQRRIPGDQCLDFAHAMKHRGAIAPAEPAPDFRHRSQPSLLL